MQNHPGQSFSFITHSVGSYSAYSALLHQEFPAAKLLNVFNLAAPIRDPPLKFYGRLESLLNRIVFGLDYARYSHVAHFNINGGIRDFNVPASLTSFELLLNQASTVGQQFHSLELSSQVMKNVFQSIDHNSQLYSRVFLNQLIPFIGQISQMKSDASERIVKAESLLSFDASKVVPVFAEL
jgi:hypothetical protein